MSAVQQAARALLDVEDHRADCPRCRPATDVFLRSQRTFEDQQTLVAQICPVGRQLWGRFWKLGLQAQAEQ